MLEIRFPTLDMDNPKIFKLTVLTINYVYKSIRELINQYY